MDVPGTNRAVPVPRVWVQANQLQHQDPHACGMAVEPKSGTQTQQHQDGKVGEVVAALVWKGVGTKRWLYSWGLGESCRGDYFRGISRINSRQLHQLGSVLAKILEGPRDKS